MCILWTVMCCLVHAGYTRLLEFQKVDGSYGAFKKTPSSIWWVYFCFLLGFFGLVFFGCVVDLVCFGFLLGGYVYMHVCFGFVAFLFWFHFFFSKIPLLSFNALEVFQGVGGHGFSKSGEHVAAYILLPRIGSHVSIWACLVLGEEDSYWATDYFVFATEQRCSHWCQMATH